MIIIETTTPKNAVLFPTYTKRRSSEEMNIEYEQQDQQSRFYILHDMTDGAKIRTKI